VITVNCIGLGHWGPNLARLFAVNPLSRLGTVCDLSEDRLALVKRNIPAQFQCSRDGMATATDPAADAVVIATPTHTHFELAQAALQSGKHVLVEKPICQTSKEAEELVKIAAQYNRILAVGHVFLFNNGIRHVKKLISSGELGKIRYIYSTRTNLGPIRSDVNAFWDLAAHDVSILNYWLDAEAESVSATGAAYLNPEVEDVVVANFVYPGKVLGCVHASWLNPKKVRDIVVVGEQKMVVWNDMDLAEPVRVYHKSVDVTREETYSDTFGKFRMQVRNGDVVIPKVNAGEPLDAECTHFLECIAKGQQPVNDGHNGVKVLRALEAADRSLGQKSAMVPVTPPALSLVPRPHFAGMPHRQSA